MDMNGDGITTISDVWAWIDWLFFYPGDYFFSVVLETPKLAQFLEMTPTIYGGWLSGVLSATAWLLAFGVYVLITVLPAAIREGWSKRTGAE